MYLRTAFSTREAGSATKNLALYDITYISMVPKIPDLNLLEQLLSRIDFKVLT